MDFTTITDARDTLIEGMQERLEYELRAAWRMDYDYVHVYDAPTPMDWDTDDHATFSIKQYVYPSNEQRPPAVCDAHYSRTYDLTSVSDAEIRAAIRGEGVVG